MIVRSAPYDRMSQLDLELGRQQILQYTVWVTL